MLFLTTLTVFCRFHIALGCEFAGMQRTGSQCHGLPRETAALFRRGRTAQTTNQEATVQGRKKLRKMV